MYIVLLRLGILSLSMLCDALYISLSKVVAVLLFMLKLLPGARAPNNRARILECKCAGKPQLNVRIAHNSVILAL